MSDDSTSAFDGDRLAKVIARAGLCSRRDAEGWIKDGRVAVNGKVIRTPAFNVTPKDQVKVDGQPLQARQGTRVWLYHKPPGLVVTEKDPEGRETVFERLEAEGLPRVVSVGRLDINTEGLLLLTNDGGLKRVLELPATGWLRRYRVRAFGTVTQAQLDPLKDGIEVDGIQYGPIEAQLEREQGSNVWLVLSLREGKNREVKNVLQALGLTVNRLIRVSYGPFQLGDLPIGAVEVVRARTLREQLGKRLADEAGVDFDSELPEPQALTKTKRANAANPAFRAAAPGKPAPRQRRDMADRAEPFHFVDRDRPERDESTRPPRKDRPGGTPRPQRSAARPAASAERPAPTRKIFFDDGRQGEFVEKSYGKKPRSEGGSEGKPAFKKSYGDKPKGNFSDRPQRAAPTGRAAFEQGSNRPMRESGDRSKRSFGDKSSGGFSDRPKRPYTGRPAAAEGTGDRSQRSFGDRPKRSFGDKPSGGNFSDRPKRSFGDKSSGGGFSDRPKRPYTGRPETEGSDRPARSFSDKPRSSRPAGDRPYGTRPAGTRPAGDRPFGQRTDGDKPKRPRGSGPGGDRPRRPRPPKS